MFCSHPSPWLSGCHQPTGFIPAEETASLWPARELCRPSVSATIRSINLLDYLCAGVSLAIVMKK